MGQRSIKSPEEFIPSVTSPCTCCCVSASSDWLSLDVPVSDALQNYSDWPNRSCEIQRHDGGK